MLIVNEFCEVGLDPCRLGILVMSVTDVDMLT
jgi:hypothetical protein